MTTSTVQSVIVGRASNGALSIKIRTYTLTTEIKEGEEHGVRILCNE